MDMKHNTLPSLFYNAISMVVSIESHDVKGVVDIITGYTYHNGVYSDNGNIERYIEQHTSPSDRYTRLRKKTTTIHTNICRALSGIPLSSYEVVGTRHIIMDVYILQIVPNGFLYTSSYEFEGGSHVR